jgi:sulfite reductase alpha subunit-like flavoprotein
MHPKLWVPSSSSADGRFFARLLDNRRITADDWEQDVRHVALDTTGSGISFAPGDVAWIYPRNNPEETDKFIQFMNLDPNAIIERIEPRGNGM